MNDYLAYRGVTEATWAVRRNGTQADAYLAHHQIKGAKHGVRRFQYEDGSWTPAGRERYGKGGEARGSYGSGDNMAERIAKKVGSTVKSAGASAYRVTRDAASSAITKAKTAHAERAAVRKEEREYKRKVRLEEWERRERAKTDEEVRKNKLKTDLEVQKEQNKIQKAKDADAKEKAESAAKRERDLVEKNKTLDKALKNKKLTTEELAILFKHFDAERQLKDLKKADVDRYGKYVQTISDVAKNGFNIADTLTKLTTGLDVQSYLKKKTQGDKKSIEELQKEATLRKTIAEAENAEATARKSKAEEDRSTRASYKEKLRKEAMSEAEEYAESVRKYYKDLGYDDVRARDKASEAYEARMKAYDERRRKGDSA